MTRPIRLLLLLTLTGGSAVGAGTIEIEPVRDNTLYEDVGGAVSNGSGQYFFAGNTANGNSRRGLVAFDIGAAVPSGSVITSAVLVLQMSKTISGSQNVELRRVLSDWGEGASDPEASEGQGAPSEPGDATWLHTFFPTDFWASIGGDFAATSSATSSVGGIGVYVWGSTPEMVADLQGWLDDPASAFGWLLLGNESTSASAKRFNTRENPDPGSRPALTIDFVPGTIFADGFESGDISAWSSSVP